MNERPLHEPHTVDVIKAEISLGTYKEAGEFDLVSSRLVVISISPLATYEETEAYLLSMVRTALRQCQKDAFPHA